MNQTPLNQPPLNPDALEAGAEPHHETYLIKETWDNLNVSTKAASIERMRIAVSAYLAVAQPEVNSFDPRELNRRGWTCGCEPGNYDSCDECQSACNELANFLNHPVVNDA